MTPFSQLPRTAHPFDWDTYIRIDAELTRLADAAAERKHAGDETYRDLVERANATQRELFRLWNAIVDHEREERAAIERQT